MGLVDAAKFTHPATMTASDSPRAQFERLLEEHAGIVRKIAFGYARTESDRRDLMQEIALQLWRAYPRYSPDRPFSTWMYRIALNVSISLLRRNTQPGRETVPFDELKHDSAHEQSIREDVFGKPPKMQAGSLRSPKSRYRGDYLKLDRDWCGQSGNFNRCAGRIRFASAGEMFGVEFVVDRKILFHVGQEHGDIDDVIPACASVFEHEPDIFKNRATLLFDVVTQNVAVGIESDAGNFLAATDPRADPGEKNKIANAFGVWERPHCFGRARTFKCLSHVVHNCRAAAAAANPKSRQGPSRTGVLRLPDNSTGK
jgi:RNA polymerase sigma factor (sigma-70 family)